MLKKSRIIAVLSVCVMVFAVVEPAFAWDWDGSLAGCIAGGVIGFFVAGPVGAVYGATGGTLWGGASDQQRQEWIQQGLEEVGQDIAYKLANPNPNP